MDANDFWRLAEDATLIFSNAAASTAFGTVLHKKGSNSVETSKRLGLLGAMLYIIHNILINPTPDEDRVITERIPKLLALLESLYTGKAQSNMPEDRRLWYPNLRNIASAETDPHDLAAALLKFATYKQETVERCFSRLRSFGVKGRSREKRKGLDQPIEHRNAKLAEQASRVFDPTAENQPHIDQAVYKSLCFPCTCSSRTRQGFVCSQHWTRIQLCDRVVASPDKEILDVVLSSIPAPSPGADIRWRWQKLRFEISKPKKAARIRVAEPLAYPNTDREAAPEGLFDLRPVENLCQFLNPWFGDLKRRLRIDGGALHEMHDPALPGPNNGSNPSMSLAKVLDTHEISSKDKIILAYILARTTWQYYSSDFMKVRWTSGTIHFIPEEPLSLDIDDYADRTKIDPSKPYLAFQFDGTDDPETTEFCTSSHVLHRYPRILALATLLMELGYPRGVLPREPTHNLQEQINNDWNKIQSSLDNEKWPNFGFQNPRLIKTYRDVVSICLDRRVFHISSSVNSLTETTPMEQRREILFNSVVYPLFQLISDGGLLEEDAQPIRATFPSSSVRPQPSCAEYTVGWICAVQVERVAACELLDEEYASPASNSAHDNNIYEFGRIGQDKVVIASLPKGTCGIAFAAAAARDMLRSFPSIKVGLMVGIAGGAPSAKHDVRLGDIVVSSPDRCSGGVVHYDFGKAIQSREFQRTGSQNSPPIFLLNAVQSLSARHERKDHQIELKAARIVQRNPRLKSRYQRPRPETDRLYQAAYLHKDDSKDCEEGCDRGKTMLQIRPHRDQTVIHYGLIASADKLMKDAQVRDALAEKEGILCFEMEAAGLMDHFPCLVIRGICDYSDTHKNDAWQGYAAVAAAAYAKELLEIIPPVKVQAS